MESCSPRHALMVSFAEASPGQDSPAAPATLTPPARSEPSPADNVPDVTPQPPAVQRDSGPGVSTLRQRIEQYRASGGQPWYETRNDQLVGTSKAHLNLEHGWTGGEMEGLTQQELDLLHGASHNGVIVADESNAVRVTSSAKNEKRNSDIVTNSGDGIPVERRADGRDYWLHPVYGWRYATGPLQEGGEYLDLIYRDGRMWPTEPTSKSVQRVQPIISQPSGYWATQCINGVCTPVWIQR